MTTTPLRWALPSCIVLAAACTSHRSDADQLPQWSYDPTMVFPADRSRAVSGMPDKLRKSLPPILTAVLP